jgi:hypothetical protein
MNTGHTVSGIQAADPGRPAGGPCPYVRLRLTCSRSFGVDSRTLLSTKIDGPKIRRWCCMGLKREIQRAIALAIKIPAIRECAVRELAASLRVIADVGVTLRQDPSGEELIRRNPLLREPLLEIGVELADETLEEIKNGLRLLRPYAVKGFKKVRFGSLHDGGYVILDDFRDVDTVFSFGIDKDATWDLDIAKKGITVYQFDHTIDRPPITDNSRLIFAKKRISTEAGPDSESLCSLVAQHDKHNIDPNILLKIDIECDEWAIFDKAPSEILRRFSQIVGEFHFFEGFSADARCRRLINRVLRKLVDSYAVIHIHANNHGDFHKAGNLAFPNVLEITFANRNLYSFSETDETFPGPLDAPNDPNRPDVHLDIWV